MLRITAVENLGENVCLKVEGRIVGNWAREFEHVCEMVLAQGQCLVLDFSDVRFIDQGGLAFLKRMSSQRIRIIKARPLVQALLHGWSKNPENR